MQYCKSEAKGGHRRHSGTYLGGRAASPQAQVARCVCTTSANTRDKRKQKQRLSLHEPEREPDHCAPSTRPICTVQYNLIRVSTVLSTLAWEVARPLCQQQQEREREGLVYTPVCERRSPLATPVVCPPPLTSHASQPQRQDKGPQKDEGIGGFTSRTPTCRHYETAAESRCCPVTYWSILFTEPQGVATYSQHCNSLATPRCDSVLWQSHSSVE